MTTLSIPQTYAIARQAGFSPTQAVTMTAIAMAESGLRTDAIGDVNLTTSGERSVGLWQINYRPRRDAGSPTRNPTANLDPLTNARNAYEISGGGKSFRPWSTYTNGAYAGNLKAVASALGGKDPVTSVGTGPGGTPTAGGATDNAVQDTADTSAPDTTGCPGPPTNPLKMPAWVLEYSSCQIGKAFEALRNEALKALLYTAAVGVGATVVVVGLRRTVDPVMQKAQQVGGAVAGGLVAGPAGAAAGAELGGEL